MKLQSVSVLLLIVCTAGISSKAVDNVCVIRFSIWPGFFWYQCSGATSDYLSDVSRAPLDLERISFTSSEIPILKNASFSRLGSTLTVLVVSNCEVAEIEDKAFEGLTELILMDLSVNKLRVLKGAWFEGIAKLKYIDLKYNDISHVEHRFFAVLPNIKLLDLSNNLLKCLTVSSMANFRVQQGIIFDNNPLSWRCRSEMVDWESNNTSIRPGTGDLGVTYNVTKNCISQSPTPDPNDDYVNSCVEKFLNELLPTEENYTLERLCQFWAEKPSITDFKCTE